VQIHATGRCAAHLALPQVVGLLSSADAFVGNDSGVTHLAAAMGAKQLFVDTDEVNIPGYSDNPPERCYYCKTELFRTLRAVAREQGLAVVCDGTNADDLGDYRPGRRAAQEQGIQSPLAELGFRKADIRTLSHQLGLPTWSKPAYACLASRFPYGEKITPERLAAVERAEEIVRQHVPGQLRVRYHGDVARIEVSPSAFPQALADATPIVAGLKQCGFRYVTLDLQGYRTGSLNEGLSAAPSLTSGRGAASTAVEGSGQEVSAAVS